MVRAVPPKAATMPNTPPLSLDDEGYSIVMRAAEPIVPSERGLFLQAMADALAQHPVTGAGLIHRLASDLQRRFVVQARSDAETRKGETHGHRDPRQAVESGPPGPASRPGGAEPPAA
jgi:hypothetical protein